MSEKAHLDAVIALLTTAGASPMTLQQIKNAGGGPKLGYTEVQVMQRFGSGPRRSGAPSQVTQWRILTRAVAELYGNAQEMRNRAAALHEAALSVGGETFFIERAVSDDPIAEDGDWWSGVSEFAY
jgi:hypothetical protein